MRSRTLTYRSWESMHNRCKPEFEAAERYADRGITIDSRWNVYERFVEDMGQRPSRLHTLDRVDNNEGYCKENCRWATKQEQAFNRRKRSDCTSKYNNVNWSAKSQKWMARVLLPTGERVYLGLFVEEDDAGNAVEKFNAEQN